MVGERRGEEGERVGVIKVTAAVCTLCHLLVENTHSGLTVSLAEVDVSVSLSVCHPRTNISLLDSV